MTDPMTTVIDRVLEARSMFENIRLFSGLDESDLESLSKHVVTKTFPKKTIVIHEGDLSDSLYVIRSGKVKVFLSDEDGKEVVLNTQGPGEYFGELALLDEAPRSASVMTLEPSQMSIIMKQDFQECLNRHPDMALRVIRGLIQTLRRLTDNVKSLALMDVYGRVASTLLELAEEKNGRLVITEKLTHQELANRVGASREMVSRILKDLSNGGYIGKEGRTMIIRERLPPGW